MFGRKGAQLCLEVLHTERDQLQRYNNDLFNQVLDEANEHYTQMAQRMETMQDDGSGSQNSADFYGALIHHTSIMRNKRCLVAYLHHRAETIQRLRWQLGSVLPEDIHQKLSPSEKDYFKEYSESLGAYMSSMDLDLTVDLTPPKDPYIQVRAMESVGDVYIDDKSTSLVRNSVHLLKRSEAEPLITQGLVEEFKL